MKKERWGIVLDYLSRDHPAARGRGPLVQLLGEDHLSLLETVPRVGAKPKPQERVYIGRRHRPRIKHIKRGLWLDELTSAARTELKIALDEILGKKEKKFIKFFNKATPLTTRVHQLELLPGIGKKHRNKILEERKREKFDSYNDLKNRIPLMASPKKLIKDRILEELDSRSERHYLFASGARKLSESHK